LSRIAPQPAVISAKNSFSQSAPLPYALVTTRITQLPPDADSMRNSVAIGVTDGRSRYTFDSGTPTVLNHSTIAAGMSSTWSAIGHGSSYANRTFGV
jgi:hypothetical protein